MTDDSLPVLRLRKSPEDDKEHEEPSKKPEQTNQREWKCTICLEDLHDPVITRCGHIFCRRCITEWLLRSSVCPYCNRKNVRASELVPIRGQGTAEDRPEPDNTLKANSFSIRFNRFLNNRLLTKDTLIRLTLIIILVLAFFL